MYINPMEKRVYKTGQLDLATQREDEQKAQDITRDKPHAVQQETRLLLVFILILRTLCYVPVVEAQLPGGDHRDCKRL